MNKQILLSILMILFGNILVWFQVNGPLMWKSFNTNVWLLCMAGMPISYVFIKATQYGYEGFDSRLWPFRILSTSIGVIVFSVMTGLYMNEMPPPKTLAALSLCIIAILIQIFL